MVIQFVIIGLIGVVMGIAQMIYMIKSKNPNRFACFNIFYNKDKYDLSKIALYESAQIILLALLVFCMGIFVDDLVFFITIFPKILVFVMIIGLVPTSVVRHHKYFRIKTKD